METVNTLSIPDLEEKIAEHQRQIDALGRELVAQRYPRTNTSGKWYYCTDCGSLYQTWQGCGCHIPALLEQIDQLKAACSAVSASSNESISNRGESK